MTSFRQIEANRRNAQNSTGPKTEEGKQRSRCNAVRHGLTAETVIGALEDAKDYEAFEAAIIGDYDAQSAVERELVLRLASLLWRLRRAGAMESGLFEIQADQLRDYRQARKTRSDSGDIIRAMFLGFERAILTEIKHRTALPTQRKLNSIPFPTPPILLAIRPLNSPVAFCVSVICLTLCLTASAATKPQYGVKSLKFCLRSTASIATNRWREGAFPSLAAARLLASQAMGTRIHGATGIFDATNNQLV